MFEFNKHIKVTVIPNKEEFHLSKNMKLISSIVVNKDNVEIHNDTVETDVILLCDLIYNNQRIKTIRQELSLQDNHQITLSVIILDILKFIDRNSKLLDQSIDEEQIIESSLEELRDEFLVQQYVEIESQ